MNKVLITGASGQLAQALAHTAPSEIECIGLIHAELDITDDASTYAVVSRLRPDLVINGAAYNLVDKAESAGIENALCINALGVAHLAKTCRDAGVPLVHFSTDFVFDGEKRQPYTESDAARPLSVYGASKLAGEHIALAASPLNIVIRVCRLFGPVAGDATSSLQKPAGNFPLLMLRLARSHESVRVVSDQIGTPTYTPDLARAVWQLARSGQGGLFQLSNAGEVAFDEYAREVFRLAGVPCKVESVTSEEYGAAAQRPRYSTLSNDKAHAAGVVPLRSWRDALAEFVEQSSNEHSRNS